MTDASSPLHPGTSPPPDPSLSPTTSTTAIDDPTPQSPPHPTPTPFKPLFTLISTPDLSTKTTEYHHPHVHYVFTDDDPDLVTGALLHTLSTSSSGPGSPNLSDSVAVADDDSDAGSPRSRSRRRRQKDTPRYPPNERLLLVDLATDRQGITVSSAKSLSPEWLVQTASVGAAPTFGDAGAEQDSTAGLMLRIDGVEAGGVGRGVDGVKAGLVEELGVLERLYGEGMERLRGWVVHVGGDGGEDKEAEAAMT